MTQYDIELEHAGAHGIDPEQRDTELGKAVAGKLRSDKLKRSEGAELTIVRSINTSGVSTVYTVEVATEPAGEPAKKRTARKATEPKTDPEPVEVVTTDDVVEPV